MYTNEQLIEFCQEAVRIPSYSGQEKGVAEFMKRKMEEYGFDEVIIDKYGSVLGTINGKRPGKTILMDGHIDTVDVIDALQWKHDPFGGEIVDGRIYGRGTSDMKGSDCAMITAAARYAEKTGKDFAGKICVSCTVHEECFEGVSSREITRLAKPDFVIIGEATTTTVKRGQRGRAEVVVETEGVSCHSSNPEKGVNAVYEMMAVIEEIRKIVPNEHPLLGKGILELTDIISKPYPGGRHPRPGQRSHRPRAGKASQPQGPLLSGRGRGEVLDRRDDPCQALFPGLGRGRGQRARPGRDEGSERRRHRGQALPFRILHQRQQLLRRSGHPLHRLRPVARKSCTRPRRIHRDRSADQGLQGL